MTHQKSWAGVIFSKVRDLVFVTSVSWLKRGDCFGGISNRLEGAVGQNEEHGNYANVIYLYIQ